MENNNFIRRQRGSEQEEDRFLMLRQILNLLFMVGAAAGLAVYFLSSTQIGTFIILFSMVLKIVECVLRLLK
ncbi:MAG: hypothetical protein IJK46_06280 [Prevotella sp.]|nr:hypothetical protein [Prevotella sp.]